MKVFDHKISNSMHLRNRQFGSYDPVRGIWNFLLPNTFIWSAMIVLLLNFFHNVSQSFPNLEFVSILAKKVIFSNRHPYSILILVS